jgi:hypothetical protein
MSTSFLYHGFGIVGYHYRSQSFQDGTVTFRIEQPCERHRCSVCGSYEVWDQGGRRTHLPYSAHRPQADLPATESAAGFLLRLRRGR